jgi:hypothetical protein
MMKVDTVTDRVMATVVMAMVVDIRAMPIPSRGMDRVTATMATPGITVIGMIGAIMIATIGATADGVTVADGIMRPLNIVDLPIAIVAMSMVGTLSSTREDTTTTIAAS